MKKMFPVIIVLALLLCVTACETAPKATPTPSPKEAAETSPTQATTEAPSSIDSQIVLKYQILESEKNPQGICMLAVKEKIEEFSSGTIKVEAYPSDMLFSGGNSTPALITGDLEMHNVYFRDIITYIPSAAMYLSPYLFSSYEHMERFFSSETVQKFYNQVSDACNFTPLAAMTQGAWVIAIKSTKPVKTPEDIKDAGLKIRGSSSSNIWNSLGSTVKPLAYEDPYWALQTGAVNADQNLPERIRTMRVYEVTKQISLTRHIIDVKLICVTNSVWDNMTEEQQGWMREAAQYAAEKANEATYAQEAADIEFFREQGLIITEPDIDAFREYSHQYYLDNGLTEDWDMEMYDAIQAMR